MRMRLGEGEGVMSGVDVGEVRRCGVVKMLGPAGWRARPLAAPALGVGLPLN
jgi:hypothetical protein